MITDQLEGLRLINWIIFLSCFQTPFEMLSRMLSRYLIHVEMLNTIYYMSIHTTHTRVRAMSYIPVTKQIRILSLLNNGFQMYRYTTLEIFGRLI